MRVSHKVNVQIGVDATFAEKLYYPEDANAQVNIDAYANEESGTISIAPSATVSLSFGQVAAVKGAFFKVLGGCTYSINGGAAITMVPATSGLPAKYFSESVHSSISITNTGATTLTGSYAVWGDLVS